MLKRERGLDSDAIGRLASGAQYAPEPLSEDERNRLDGGDMAGAPRMCRAIIRNGSIRHFTRVFGDGRAEEGAALAARAPLDLRVNTLKAEPDVRGRGDALDLLLSRRRWSPWGLRIALRADGQGPAIMPSPPSSRG